MVYYCSVRGADAFERAADMYRNSLSIDNLLDASQPASESNDQGEAIYPADIKVEKESFSFYELKRMVVELKEVTLGSGLIIDKEIKSD